MLSSFKQAHTHTCMHAYTHHSTTNSLLWVFLCMFNLDSISLSWSSLSQSSYLSTPCAEIYSYSLSCLTLKIIIMVYYYYHHYCHHYYFIYSLSIFFLSFILSLSSFFLSFLLFSFFLSTEFKSSVLCTCSANTLPLSHSSSVLQPTNIL